MNPSVGAQRSARAGGSAGAWSTALPCGSLSRLWESRCLTETQIALEALSPGRRAPETQASHRR